MITLDKLLTELNALSLNEIIAGHGHTQKNKSHSSSNKKPKSNSSGKKKKKNKKNNTGGSGCCDSRTLNVLAPE